MRASSTARAFTLLEILVVLAIVGALAALLFPLTSRMIEGGRATACLSNLRQLGAGLNGYLGEHELMMPTLVAGRSALSDDGPTIDTVLLPYVASAAVFACPADPTFAKTSGTSYFWNSALNGQSLGNLSFLLTDSQSQIPVLSDKEGFHPYVDNKVNLLYADGHATKDLSFSTK